MFLQACKCKEWNPNVIYNRKISAIGICFSFSFSVAFAQSSFANNIPLLKTSDSLGFMCNTVGVTLRMPSRDTAGTWALDVIV